MVMLREIVDVLKFYSFDYIIVKQHIIKILQVELYVYYIFQYCNLYLPFIIYSQNDNRS